MRSLRPLLLIAAVLTVLALGGRAHADAGVLIPWSVSHEPDPAILALRRMEVKVTIDDQHAEVQLAQVFENLTGSPLEARYVLPLGPRAQVAAFALWEGTERRRGQVVEKKKGRRIFEELARQRIDPGLLEHADEEEQRGAFHLRVAPVAPHATARIEVTYVEELPLVSLGSLFTLPLKPRRYGRQKVGDLEITVAIKSTVPLARLKVTPTGWLRPQPPFAPGAHDALLTYRGRDVALTADLTCELALDVKGVRHVFMTHRDVVPGGRRDRSAFGGEVYRDPRGYFLSRTILNLSGTPPGGRVTRSGRDLVVLLDASLSMQWDKLERSFQALEYFLRHLQRDDRFTLILFNDEVHAAFPTLVPASRETVNQALRFVERSYLMGGTDLGGALTAALAAARAAGGRQEKAIIAITDGNPTVGELGYRQLGAAFARANRRRDGSVLARLFVFGVGDDTNATLLGALTQGADGFFAAAREGEDLAFRLRTFFEKLGQGSLREVAIAFLRQTGITQVLPAQVAALFDGSDAVFVGRYARPKVTAQLRLRATERGHRREDLFTVAFPERDLAHPWIARLWAKLRIDQLLEKIALEGERPAYVNEIVALAKEHNLATPYTSFIAAARALLRPRDIQPGDPVLRVKAGPEIVAVTAVFPFGLVKELAYLADEGIFETRFLAPVTMRDGRHEVALILTDRDGRKRREVKHFVIDSQPPRLTLRPARSVVRPGERLEVLVAADADTRRITLRLGDGPPAAAVWDPARKASRALVEVPDLPTGSYELRAVAEDFAHNTSSTATTLTVVGG